MTQIKPIAMRCTEEQFNAIRPKLEKAGLVITDMESFLPANYLVNNFRDDLGIVTNLRNPYGYERPIFEEWNEQTFLEHCGIESKEPIKQEPMKKYTNYIVPATDVLKIRLIACLNWKPRFTRFLERIDTNNNVLFSEEEIDEMFKAATDRQRPVLVEIFGEPKPVFTPKPGDMVWCWDDDHRTLKAAIFYEFDQSKIRKYSASGYWWENVAPFNNGQIPEEWLKRFEAQVTSLQLQKQ